MYIFLSLSTPNTTLGGVWFDEKKIRKIPSALVIEMGNHDGTTDSLSESDVEHNSREGTGSWAKEESSTREDILCTITTTTTDDKRFNKGQ